MATTVGSSKLVIGLVWPYTEWGGAQTYLVALAAELSVDHEIVAFMPNEPSQTLVALLAEAGVQVVETGRAVLSRATPTVRGKIERRLADTRAHIDLVRTVRNHHPRPDVLDVDIPVWNGFLALCALMQVVPVVQTFHTPMEPPRLRMRDQMLRAKLRFLARRSGYRFTAATEATARSVRHWIGDGHEIDVFCVVDLHAARVAAKERPDRVRSDLGISKDRWVIGSLGQLIPRKGLDLTLEVARMLVDDGLDIHVLFGGEGSEETALREQAAALGIAERLTIIKPDELGPSHAAQLRVLRALDVLVMPSRDEGLPLTLLEALALGLPAVVTDVGSIGSVFRGGDHLLFVPADAPDLLREAVKRALLDGELADRLGRAGREFVEVSFDPRDVAARRKVLLTDLVHRRRAQSGHRLWRRRFRPASALLLALVLLAAVAPKLADVTGLSSDRKATDSSSLAVVRPPILLGGAEDGVTWLVPFAGTVREVILGAADDTFLTGDVDGDGKDDIATWSPGSTQAVFRVITNGARDVVEIPFGRRGDDASVIGDWNGDGADDLAVYRPAAATGEGTFYWAEFDDPEALHSVVWGDPGDVAVSLDFDGDGRTDPAVLRPDPAGRLSMWILPSSGGSGVVIQSGLVGDDVAVGDYDGDGRDDFALSRLSDTGDGLQRIWYVLGPDGKSAAPVPFGLATDTPVGGDYDGDEIADIAIWRDGSFWALLSTNGATAQFVVGVEGDLPVSAFRVHRGS